MEMQKRELALTNKVDWKNFTLKRHYPLWAALLLSLDMRPRVVSFNDAIQKLDGIDSVYTKRWRLAKDMFLNINDERSPDEAAVDDEFLRIARPVFAMNDQPEEFHDNHVDLHQFVRFAKKHSWSLPTELEELLNLRSLPQPAVVLVGVANDKEQPDDAAGVGRVGASPEVDPDAETPKAKEVATPSEGKVNVSLKKIIAALLVRAFAANSLEQRMDFGITETDDFDDDVVQQIYKDLVTMEIAIKNVDTITGHVNAVVKLHALGITKLLHAR